MYKGKIADVRVIDTFLRTSLIKPCVFGTGPSLVPNTIKHKPGQAGVSCCQVAGGRTGSNACTRARMHDVGPARGTTSHDAVY